MMLPTADPRRKPLTDAGGFHLCRHPQYAGLLALCLSVCLLSQSADRLFYTMLLMIVLDKKADLEEQSISEEHPEYSKYLLRVPKFVPNVSPPPQPPRAAASFALPLQCCTHRSFWALPPYGLPRKPAMRA